MAESKGTMLAKSMQKHAGRAKEKILQNLGKVDRTADEIFDDHLNNFNRQQASANRLQKEFNNYIRCIRAAQTASKSLMDAISEIYEPQWTGYDALQAQTAASESLWQDFAHKLGDQVLIPLNTYTGQFPEMKKKVEKRNRKLIDYDSQRHSFQSLQASANKRKDDVKLTKGREQLEEARRTYEILNTELHDELPALYDSRILFLVTNLQTLFATEQVFHNETAKIYAELEAIVDKLATDSQRGSNTLRKQAMNAIKSSSPVQSPVKQMNNTNNINASNNYQNQITTNGSSNVNSPSSSPSKSSPQQQKQQEARPDSVSPTPENTTLDVPKSTTTPNATPPTTNISATPPPQQQRPAVTNVENIASATIEKPSSQTTVAIAEATITESLETKPIANSDKSALSTNEVEEEIKTSSGPNDSPKKSAKASDEISNNTITAIPTAASSDDVTKPAAADPVTTSKIAKATPSIPIKGQLNGNGNANEIENGNGNSNNNNSCDSNNTSIEDKNKSLDATTTDLPPGVLYRVKATYGYVKEDEDELSFEVGDIIRVIEYDDPEDQEEGWLMGQKEGSDEKGLFPANFTRPI